MENPTITPSFEKALEALQAPQRNVFITGKAGSGKSTLLQHYLRHSDKTNVVLAPTGVAALNVGGATIHSFFGFRPSITVEKAQQLGTKARSDDLYKNIDMIVIDEISMVRADLLDCVDLFLQHARKKKESFGGVKMVFIGDLYQLPPVVSKEEREWFQEMYTSPYFFSSRAMQTAQATFTFIELDHIFRQTDGDFIALLNAIRNRSITDEQLYALNKRVEAPQDDEGYIYLTGTNASAETINQTKLAKLAAPLEELSAEIDGNFEKQTFPAAERLRLKKGAQVMFVANNPPLWVNGSIGKVEVITDDEIEVRLDDGAIVKVRPYTWKLLEYVYDDGEKMLKQDEKGSFTQFPLRLAWAITIHKSQGKTFDRVILDLDRVFAHGQLYVALSRCSSFEGLMLAKPVKKGHIRLDFTIVQFLTQFQYAQSEKAHSIEEKTALIDRAIEAQCALDITYLKASDEKTHRCIRPIVQGTFHYQSKAFHGVKAYCLNRQEERMFRVDRILAMQLALPTKTEFP